VLTYLSIVANINVHIYITYVNLITRMINYSKCQNNNIICIKNYVGKIQSLSNHKSFLFLNILNSKQEIDAHFKLLTALMQK